MATKFLKYFSKNIAIATIIISSSFSNSYAISDDECAIWLCAPAGFGPSECGPAHSAMIRRVHRGQGPLPPFSLCNKHSSNSNISNTEMTSADGYAAYIPSHTICTQYKEEIRYGNYGPQKVKTCVAYGPSGDSWVKDRGCIHSSNGHTDPQGCTTTGYYVEVFVDGVKVGETYFFNF
ncbi:MAG: hypothetical protein ACI4V7_11185 [Succinivibrionaceae bacterium]